MGFDVSRWFSHFCGRLTNLGRNCGRTSFIAVAISSGGGGRVITKKRTRGESRYAFGCATFAMNGYLYGTKFW